MLQSKYSLIIGLLLLFGGIYLAVYLQIPSVNYMLYSSWIALPSFIMIIMSLGKLPLEKLEHNNAIQYLSAISYVFFMAQFFVWKPCQFIFEKTGYDSNVFRIMLSLFMCFALSIIMHECFEKPVTKWLKNKLIK